MSYRGSRVAAWWSTRENPRVEPETVEPVIELHPASCSCGGMTRLPYGFRTLVHHHPCTVRHAIRILMYEFDWLVQGRPKTLEEARDIRSRRG